MTLDDFLDKLDGVRASGSGYVALCPGHEDNEPSLSITEGDDGRILVKCQAGCETEDVVAGMELTLRDLFTGPNLSEPEAVYQYTDESGVVLFEVVRFPGKNFRQRRLLDGGEYEWKLGDVRRVLYRLPNVLQAKAEGRTIYLVGGEKDVESLEAKGYVATTNPGGENKWEPEHTDTLAGAAKVIIIADRDVTGRKHAERVKHELTGRVGKLWIMQSAKGKDVSDHLAAGLPVEKLLPLRSGPRRGLITARELADEGLEVLEKRESEVPGYQLWPGIPLTFRPARIYLLGGYTSDGKTSLMMQGVRTIAELGIRVGVHSNEMSSGDLRNKLLAHAGIPLRLSESPWKIREDPEMHRLYQEELERIAEWNLDINFDTNMTAEKIAAISQAQEHDFIVIDHVHRFGWGRERRTLEEQLQKLTNLSLELNVPILVLAQLRRMMRGKDIAVFPRPTVQDFRETGVAEQESAMALAIWRARDEGGMTFTGTQELIILKNRFRTSPLDETGRSYMPSYDRDRELFNMGGEPQHGGNYDAGGSQQDAEWNPA